MNYDEFLESLEELGFDLETASEGLDVEIKEIKSWKNLEEIPQKAIEWLNSEKVELSELNNSDEYDDTNEDEMIEASGDYSNSHKSNHVENTIQSTEIEKFTEENKMVDSGKKSELKKVEYAKSGCSKLKMSSDVIELIRNQCGKHKSAAMAKALNVSVRAVQSIGRPSADSRYTYIRCACCGGCDA